MRQIFGLVLLFVSAAAAAGEIHVAVRNGDLEKVAKLLDADPGLLTSQANQYAISPLHVAAHDGRVEIAKLLIDRGAPLELRDRDQATPLFAAALKGHAAVAHLLLDAGADPNAKADEDVRPLHLAAMNGHLEVVKLLLDAKADVNVKDTSGFTPLGLTESSERAIVRLLKAHGAR